MKRPTSTPSEATSPTWGVAVSASPRRVPRIRLLAGGHLVIASTILLGVAAVHTGLNLLHALVAVLLAFQAVSGFRSFLVLRRLRVDLVAPPHVDVGGETVVVLTVANGKRRTTSVSLEAEVVVEGGRGGLDVARGWIGRVAPGAEVAIRLAATGRERGPARLATLRLSTSYPCDLFRRTLIVPLDVEVLVRPRRTDGRGLGVLDERAGRLPSRGRARTERAADGELRRLRPYRPGDPPRSIHWKTTARRGSLHVREDEVRRRASWAVVLAPAPSLPPAAVEEAVSRAAGLCEAAVRAGGDAWLCVAGASSALPVRDARSLGAALDALARFVPSESPPPATPPGSRLVAAREPASCARAPEPAR